MSIWLDRRILEAALVEQGWEIGEASRVAERAISFVNEVMSIMTLRRGCPAEGPVASAEVEEEACAQQVGINFLLASMVVSGVRGRAVALGQAMVRAIVRRAPEAQAAVPGPRSGSN